MESNDPLFKSFLHNNLTNLIKNNTGFKQKESSIDHILTNMKYTFKYTSSSYETGLSDHHHMICVMFKSSFINIEPNLLNYRQYKNIYFFWKFKEYLSEALLNYKTHMMNLKVPL